MRLWQSMLAGMMFGAVVGFLASLIPDASAKEPRVPEFYMCGKHVHIEGLREAYLQDGIWQLIVEMRDIKVIHIDTLMGIHCA